jgi:photosystem II stability/assembly factor-like uncharacterized protein
MFSFVSSELSRLRGALIAFTVALSACGGAGDSTPLVPPPQPPAAVPAFSITGASAQAETGSPLSLSTTAMADTTGFSYRWDFGDGTSSTSPAPTKSYAAAGTYALSLTITGAAGDSRTAAANVVVGRFSLTRDLRCTGATAGSGWCHVVSVPPARDPTFADASNGWAIGDDTEFEGRGDIFRTTDGGKSWTRHLVGPRFIRNVRFVDARSGVLLASEASAQGQSGPLELWATSDGGLTWARRGALPSHRVGTRFDGDALSPISLSTDALRVAVRREDGGFYLSQNGGSTWNSTTLPGTVTPSGTLFQLDGPTVLRSTDSGSTSSAVRLSDAGSLRQIAFSNDSQGWIYGSNDGQRPSVWRTTDGGATWARTDAAATKGPPSLNPHNLDVHGGGTLWLTDRPSDIFVAFPVYRSTDGGITWQQFAPPGASPGVAPGPLVTVRSDQIASARTGCRTWAVTQDGGTTWTDLSFPARADSSSDCLVELLPPGGSMAAPLLRVGSGWYRSANGGADWDQVLGPLPMLQGRSLSSIWFHDPLRWDASTLTTRDAGRTWTSKTALFGTQNGINLHYGNGGMGWAAPSELNTLDVYRTTDYGQTWVEGRLPAAGTLGGFGNSTTGLLHFINDREGWLIRHGLDVNVDNGVPIVSQGRAIWATTDGGLTWLGLGTGPSLASPATMAFVNSTTGFVTGADGGLARTQDGGRTWQTLAPAVTGLGRLYFVNESLGFSLGRNQVFRTADGGNTWTSWSIPLDFDDGGGYLGGLQFVDARTGWLVGREGLVMVTIDGGLTWTRQASGTLTDLVGVYATDARTVWAVDRLGRPLVTATGGH